MSDYMGSVYYNKKLDKNLEARLIINSDNPLDFEKYLNILPDIFERSSSLIYKNSRNIIKSFKSEFGLVQPIIIKKFGQNGLYDNIRFRVSKSRAYRSFRAACWLQDLDILIPKPYLAIEYRAKGNKLINSYYISEFVNFNFDLYKVYQDNPLIGKLDDLIKDLASDIRKIHDNDILYRDLHPSNIHFLIDENNSYKYYFIDFNRIKKSNNLSIKMRAKDLCRLRIPDEYIDLFLDNYDSEISFKLKKYIIRYYKWHINFKKFKEKIRG